MVKEIAAVGSIDVSDDTQLERTDVVVNSLLVSRMRAASAVSSRSDDVVRDRCNGGCGRLVAAGVVGDAGHVDAVVLSGA